MKNIEEIFQDRTYYKFSNKPVSTEIIKEIYDLMKLGPTSGNSCPLRITFIESEEAKEKLYPCLMPGNVEKVRSAPVAAIFAYDTKFYDEMPKLFPGNKGMHDYFASSESIALDTAYRNSTLQAAYFMVIARGKGLACGPLSGFNNAEVDKIFLGGTSYKSNFICNIGYPDGHNNFPRLPRLEFDECCKIT